MKNSASFLRVLGPEGAFYLSQTVAGQSQTSPCVDAGDPESGELPGGTTRTDEMPDDGRVDLGFHFSAPDSPPVPTPTPAAWAGIRLTLSDTDLQVGDRFMLTATCRAPAGHPTVDVAVARTILDFTWPAGDFGEMSDLVVLGSDPGSRYGV